jgi:hypothetical protein
LVRVKLNFGLHRKEMQELWGVIWKCLLKGRCLQSAYKKPAKQTTLTILHRHGGCSLLMLPGGEKLGRIIFEVEWITRRIHDYKSRQKRVGKELVSPGATCNAMGWSRGSSFIAL